MLASGRVGPDSCVLVARITSEVLHYFGVPHQVSTTECIIFNKAAWAMAAAGERPDNGLIYEGEECWTLAIEEQKHVIVTTSTHLIDLSADQFDRPAKNLPMEPIVVEVGWNDEGWCWLSDDDTGMVVGYKLVPKNKWWSTSPNWGKRDEWVRRPIIAWTIKRTKELEAL